MTETVPLTEARNRLSELAGLVEITHERIVATRNERPAEFIYGDLAESPLRVGKPLHGELEGKYSTRRGTYRLVYSISNGDNPVIRIARVDHRRDVYR